MMNPESSEVKIPTSKGKVIPRSVTDKSVKGYISFSFFKVMVYSSFSGFFRLLHNFRDK